MKSARRLLYFVMPAIFLLSLSPLVYYAHARTSGNLFGTPEQVAFLKANPPPAKPQQVAEAPRAEKPKRPQLLVSISTEKLVLNSCTEASPQVATNTLVATP